MNWLQIKFVALLTLLIAASAVWCAIAEAGLRDP
jgi:hypothetical protein